MLSRLRPFWRFGDREGLTSQIQHVEVEPVIAASRALMAAVALVATWIDPTEPRKFVTAVYAMLGGYTLYSLVVWRLLDRVPARWGGRLGVPLLVIDLVWVTVISLLTEATGSLFFVFFVFVLLSTAYRWGLRETLIVGAVTMVMLNLQALFALYFTGYVDAIIETNRLIIRNANLLLVAFLAGSLADREKRARGRAVTLAALLAQVHVDSGLRQSLHAVLNRLLFMFGGHSAAVVFEQADTERLFIAQVRPRREREGTTLVIRRLPRDEREQYLFDVPGPADCWDMVWPAGRDAKVVAIDAQGQEIAPGGPWPIPGWIPRDQSNVVAVTFRFGHEWRGRMFLLGVEPTGAAARRLRRLQEIVRHVGPSLYGLYLLRYLQSRADLTARADVAEELHQGIIQSLVGVEMQVDVLARSERGLPPDVTAQLERVRDALAREIRGVRGLMYHLRQPVVAPSQLPAFLKDLVDRFGQETGISSTFACEEGVLPFSPRRCREVVNFVRESLTNVRKHSGAKSVVVTLEPCCLTVTDDGRGLGGATPAALAEQARLSNVTLVVGTGPGGGTRIEVQFPEEAPWTPRLA